MTEDSQGEGSQLGTMTGNPVEAYFIALFVGTAVCGSQVRPHPGAQRWRDPPPSPLVTPALTCLSQWVCHCSSSLLRPLNVSCSPSHQCRTCLRGCTYNKPFSAPSVYIPVLVSDS